MNNILFIINTGPIRRWVLTAVALCLLPGLFQLDSTALANSDARIVDEAIERLVQQNQDHSYSYDRDELIAILDEALAD